MAPRAMRAIWIVGVCAACASEPTLRPKPLPPLAAPRAPAQELVLDDLGLVPGEHWIWEVQVRGMSIGRCELTVADTQVTSRFRTNALVRAFTSIEHDLVTTLDRTAGQPFESIERVEWNGKLRQYNAHLAGTNAHTFHSALAAVRVWAQRGAAPAYLMVTHADELFRLELAQPIVQDGKLRVDGRVTNPENDPISLSIWFDEARRPMRIEIRSNGEQITAELIETSG